MCACRACKILFDSGAAGGGHYRLVPERRLRFPGFEIDDGRGRSCGYRSTWRSSSTSTEGRVVAYYPSPAGPTESLLELDAWSELERANPVLGDARARTSRRCS